MTKPEWFVQCEHSYHNTVIDTEHSKITWRCETCGRFEGWIEKPKDVVEELRELNKIGGAWEHPIFAKAADEIESLRGKLKSTQDSYKVLCDDLTESRYKAQEVADLLASRGFGDAGNVLDRVRSLLAAYETLRHPLDRGATLHVPYYNEACAKCGVPRDLHRNTDAPRESSPHAKWGWLTCREFVRCCPPRAAYGELGK